MADRSILVVGSLHFDIVIDAPHLPAIDETVMGGPVRFVCGGKGGNQAVAAAGHGARVAMAARIGDDWFGHQLRQNLAEAGVETSLLQQDDAVASGMSVAIVDQRADYGAVVASGANGTLDPHSVGLPENTGLLMLQNEIPEPANIAIAEQARAAGATVMLNAAPMREMHGALLATIAVLILNRVEASAYFSVDGTGRRDLEDCLEAREDGPLSVVVTLGSDGLLVHRLGEAARHHPAFSVQARSTHGAGDHFAGALAARLVAGDDFADALVYAQAAAALFVTQPPAVRLKPDAERIASMLAERRA